mgnify:FL=1
MVMVDLDKMFKDVAGNPEEAAQLQELEEQEGGPYELKPTGVQISHNSRPVTIYHTVTGEPRTMPWLYAQTALLKKFRAKDGPGLADKFVFRAKPTVPWVLGSVKCLLHPDRPERNTYNSWGLPVCRSEHFPSNFEAERHMQTDHPSAWGRIEEVNERKREDEDRHLQREGIKTQNRLLKQLAKGRNRKAKD